MVELDSGRPVGAIVGLPAEVAAIIVDLSPMVTVDTEACQDWGSVWIACGAEVSCVIKRNDKRGRRLTQVAGFD